MSRRPLWVDLRHVPRKARLGYLKAAREAGAELLLHDGEDAALVDGKGRIQKGGATLGQWLPLAKPADQRKAARAKGLVVVEAADWKVIPLENLVAARRDRPGTLFALAASAEQAGLFAHVLETGVHGVVLRPATPADILAADQALRTSAAAKVPPSERAADAPVGPSGGSGALETATVAAVSDAGMGDRVCVDTTSRLEADEGLLVGSTARCLALVLAETAASGFVAPRPFRVNAGALHGYTLVGDGKTRYLSELAAGDVVEAVRRDGSSRLLTVGRAKVEARPHTLVSWRLADGSAASAVLQNAETVALCAPDGTRVPLHELKPGQSILVRRAPAARHFGMPVDARVEER